MDEMNEILITITRKEGHLGFNIQHDGIFPPRNSRELYMGGAGTMQGLRESLMSLLDQIEDKDKKRVSFLRQVSRNELLSPGFRNAVIEELNRWERAVDDNQREKDAALSKTEYIKKPF